MNDLFQKLKGDKAQLPPTPPARNIALAWLGGALAIGIIAGYAEGMTLALVLGSFGASCVLVFGYPDVPFSQPRHVIGGHFLSSLIGLVFLSTFGPHWWSVALAVGTAIAVMMWTGTVHPPAGSNPVIIYLIQPDWSFLLTPTLAGAALLVAIAAIYNNVTRPTRYPKYW